MIGRIFLIAMLVTATIAGFAIWYLQVYAYYEPVESDGTTDVMLTSVMSGMAEPILYDNFRAIDADSSPIRYRACFETAMSQPLLTETYELYDGAAPKVAPGWFDCFDAEEIGGDLEEGRALAFLGQRNIVWGVDRIVAIHADGRGYVWHQLNDCGEKAYDGTPLGDDCPSRTEQEQN